MFITINMRLNGLPEGKVDLVVSDHTPILKSYITNLADSGLFENIYYIKSLEFNNYFWGVPNEKKMDAFFNCTSKLKRALTLPAINYGEYDNLYTANLDAYTKCLYKKFPNLNIYQIEDGAASCSTDWKKISQRWNYIEGFNKIYDDVKALYLYSPDLMCFESSIPKIQLPKIHRSVEVIELFNKIFDYKKVDFPKFVFVEQSFQVDNIKNNDLEFMQITMDTVGYHNLYVKTHPRNTINRSFVYGLSKMRNEIVPFELMLLNCEKNNSVFITIDSGSLISPRVIFDDDIKTILLYKAVIGKTHNHNNKEFSIYMDKFCNKYKSPNLMIPYSLKEYICMLTHLR